MTQNESVKSDLFKFKSILIFLLLFCGALVYWSVRKDPIHEALFKESSPQAPPYTLQIFQGEATSLAAYRGKVILLNFWASWCGPCREEIPTLVSLYRKLKDRNFVIMAVNLDENPNEVIPHLKHQFGISFPIATEIHPNEGRDLFKIGGLPFNVLIDQKGRIRMTEQGARNWNDPKVIRILEQLIREADTDGSPQSGTPDFDNEGNPK